MQSLALSRLRAVGLQRGRESVKGELGVLVGQVRRLLSVAAVKSQAECLLSRMRVIGKGTAAAGRRRQGKGERDHPGGPHAGQVSSEEGPVHG